MPILSTFGSKSLGFTSYISPPRPVTGLGVTYSYSSGYTATASWTNPEDTNLTALWIEWSTNGGSSFGSPVQLAKDAVTASLSVSGGASVVARVKAQNSSLLYGDPVTSSTVLVTPDPVTSLTASNGASPGDTTVTWTNPASLTGITVSRTIGTTTTNFTPGVVTSYNDSPGQSQDVTYNVVATNASGSSPTTTATVRTVPSPPTVVSFTASNPGNLTLVATEPTHANISGYQAALETAGSWGTEFSTGSVADYGWSTAVHGTTYRARTRTVDTFGQYSSWSTSASATGVNDTTGPSVPVPTATWSQGLPGFVVSWTSITDSQSAVASASIEVSYDSGGSSSTLVSNASTSGSSYNHTLADGYRGTTIQYRVRATDSLGNVSVSSWRVVTAKPKGTFYVSAVSTATWETAGTPSWRTDTDDVISGYADATYATQSGYWFYGNTGVSNVCKGYAPDSGTIYMKRKGSNGYTGYNNIALHSHGTRPTTASYDNTTEDQGPYISGSDADATYTLPSSWLTKFGNGTAKGVVAVDSGSYRRLYGVSTNIASGKLTLVFN